MGQGYPTEPLISVYSDDPQLLGFTTGGALLHQGLIGNLTHSLLIKNNKAAKLLVAPEDLEPSLSGMPCLQFPPKAQLRDRVPAASCL